MRIRVCSNFGAIRQMPNITTVSCHWNYEGLHLNVKSKRKVNRQALMSRHIDRELTSRNQEGDSNDNVRGQ